MLLDTSGLLALVDADSRWMQRCSRALAAARGPFRLSPFVMAELDYMVTRKVGAEAALSLAEEVGRGVFVLEPFDAHDIAAAAILMRKYPGIGLTDASIVVLADRYDIYDVLTLDERHFRALRGAKGQRFRLLPADAVS